MEKIREKFNRVGSLDHKTKCEYCNREKTLNLLFNYKGKKNEL